MQVCVLVGVEVMDSHIVLIITVPPQPPLATWSVSCYDLIRDKSWLQRNQAKPNTSLLQLDDLNQTHTEPSHTPLKTPSNKCADELL